MSQSIFGHPIGTCDWCGTPAQKLYEHGNKNVCAPCRDILRDYDRVATTEEASREIHNVIKHADKNYPYP